MSPTEISDDELPSYQESFQISNISNLYPNFLSQPQPQPQPQPRSEASHLQSRLATTRISHINSIITTSILPVIHDRASTGLSRTSIALVPSPATQLTSISHNTDSKSNSLYTDDEIDFKTATVLGLVSHDADDDLQQLPLTEPMDTTQFWSQDVVVNELRRTLGAKLADEGFGAFEAEPMAKVEDVVIDRGTQRSPPAVKSRGFFSRKWSGSKVDSSKAGDEPVSQQTARTVSSKPTIDVDVVLDEICLRMQSAFGLYQTLTKPALIVRVYIRG